MGFADTHYKRVWAWRLGSLGPQKKDTICKAVQEVIATHYVRDAWVLEMRGGVDRGTKKEVKLRAGPA